MKSLRYLLFGDQVDDSSASRETLDESGVLGPPPTGNISSGDVSTTSEEFDPVAALMRPPNHPYCQSTTTTSTHLETPPDISSPGDTNNKVAHQKLENELQMKEGESNNKLTINSMSFACGGWLFIYMFGVAKAMQESKLLANHVDLKKVKYLGCSAGGLCAAGMALEGDFEAAKQFAKERCVTRAYESIRGIFRIGEYVTECLEVAVDLTKVTSVPTGHLQIQYTKLPFFNGELVQEYESKDDIQQCLLSSAAAFPFAPLIYHRGHWNVDGGYTGFQPIIDDNTVTVSPLYFMNTDIKPSRYVPLWWALLPPNSPDTVDWLFDLGYNDGVNWIHSKIENQNADNASAPSETRKRRDSCHPFDIPRQISMHRFLGFDVADLTHWSVSVFMDFFLYLLLLVVWKPLAVTLIYSELLVKIIILVTASILYELLDLFPMLFVAYALLAPRTMLVLWMLGFMALVKLLVVGPAKGSHLSDLWDCLRCVWSFSLLRRYIPTSLSNLSKDPLKKHVHLNKSSLVYRIVRHFV